MKQIAPFKKIFASVLFLCALLFGATAATAQTVFPITARATANKDNTVTVTVTNTKAVSYTARVSLTDTQDPSAYFWSNLPEKVIVPGTAESFIFKNVQNNRAYEVSVRVTTDATPSATSVWAEKKIGVIGSGKDLAASTNPPAQTATTDKSQTPAQQNVGGAGSCADKIDNDGDGRIDWNGGEIGGVPVPPDPACINAKSTEYADGNCSDGIDNNGDGFADGADPSCKFKGPTGVAVGIEGSIIPCENKCDLGSVMILINNIIEVAFKFVLFPVVIFMFIYAGYSYITAGANVGKKVSVRKMIGHIILGMVIMLCAWLIVTSVLKVLGYTDSLFFFDGIL